MMRLTADYTRTSLINSFGVIVCDSVGALGQPRSASDWTLGTERGTMGSGGAGIAPASACGQSRAPVA